MNTEGDRLARIRHRERKGRFRGKRACICACVARKAKVEITRRENTLIRRKLIERHHRWAARLRQRRVLGSIERGQVVSEKNRSRISECENRTSEWARVVCIREA